MPKKIEETLHILCPSRAYLAPAKVMGPIVHPLLVNKSVAVELLMSGAEVYEYIPKTKKTLELTLGNINDPHRYDEVKAPIVHKEIPVTPVKVMGVPTVKVTTDTSVVDEPVSTQVEMPVEPVIEAVVTPVEEDQSQKDGLNIVFEYNEDGTIDETKIEWSKYSKNQRKDIRAQINEHNSSLNQ